MACPRVISQHTGPAHRIWLILNNETHVQFFCACFLADRYSIVPAFLLFFCETRRNAPPAVSTSDYGVLCGARYKKEKKMGLLELFILAVGLSMDAFAVSVCKGLAMPKISLKKAAIVGAWFGGFQALMPSLGYLLGYQFRDKITAIDHWIAFVLLAVIGAGMIKEACSKEEENEDERLDVRTMFLLAVATSIDALAVGITFAFLEVHLVAAVSFIGVTTFIISALGVKIGNVFGTRYKSKAELAGGVILILLGTKILLEHLGIL